MPIIHINTAALTYPQFLIPGKTNFMDGSTSPAIDLSAGIYNFQQASGYYADFSFEVKTDGTVDYSDVYAGFLGGRGTPTLVVSGFLIHFDATALSHGLLPMIAGAAFLAPDSPHDLRLVPAFHYGFQPGSGIGANF